MIGWRANGALALTALLSVAPSAAIGASPQRISDAGVAVHSMRARASPPTLQRQREARASTGTLVVGGLLGAAALGGIGYLATQDCGDFECILPLLVLTIASPIAIPTGVHLANDQRGRLLPAVGLSYLAAALCLGAGALAEQSGHRAWPFFLASIPVIQLVSSVRTELVTARAKR